MRRPVLRAPLPLRRAWLGVRARRRDRALVAGASLRGQARPQALALAQALARPRANARSEGRAAPRRSLSAWARLAMRRDSMRAAACPGRSSTGRRVAPPSCHSRLRAQDASAAARPGQPEAQPASWPRVWPEARRPLRACSGAVAVRADSQRPLGGGFSTRMHARGVYDRAVPALQLAGWLSSPRPDPMTHSMPAYRGGGGNDDGGGGVQRTAEMAGGHTRRFGAVR